MAASSFTRPMIPEASPIRMILVMALLGEGHSSFFIFGLMFDPVAGLIYFLYGYHIFPSKEPRSQSRASKAKISKLKTEIPKQVRDDEKRDYPIVMLNPVLNLIRYRFSIRFSSFLPLADTPSIPVPAYRRQT